LGLLLRQERTRKTYTFERGSGGLFSVTKKTERRGGGNEELIAPNITAESVRGLFSPQSGVKSNEEE